MGMAATAWDVLEKTANVLQIFAVLVAVFTSLLRIQQSNKRQCAELERCNRKLHELLQWPVAGSGGGGGVTLLLCCEVGHPFRNVLRDAARLVESYKKSTLWRRLWSGGRTATQLRDMQDVVDSYCELLLFVYAHLLLQQQANHHHPVPSSPDTNNTRVPEVNDTSHNPGAQAVTSRPADIERANDVGQGGIDTDDTAGCERNVPALLPIVISHA